MKMESHCLSHEKHNHVDYHMKIKSHWLSHEKGNHTDYHQLPCGNNYYGGSEASVDFVIQDKLKV